MGNSKAIILALYLIAPCGASIVVADSSQHVSYCLLTFEKSRYSTSTEFFVKYADTYVGIGSTGGTSFLVIFPEGDECEVYTRSCRGVGEFDLCGDFGSIPISGKNLKIKAKELANE